ncbi:MAG: AraC family ligand binding domain-containing protein [Candidatus Acidiferrales bacterium]
MRLFLSCAALIGLAISGYPAALSTQSAFPPPPKVPADRVLIVSAETVALAQTRVPGVGTTLYDGGTFAASGLRRDNAEEGPVRHAITTEVYVIQSGSGTYTSGGTLVGPLTQHPGVKDATFGTAIQGGESHEVKAGDVVVIPAGVPHQFTAIHRPVAYINVKFEAKK